jgi:hypothetical protein
MGVDQEEIREAGVIRHEDIFCCGATCKRAFVHAMGKHEEELVEFGRQGVALVPPRRGLKAPCPLCRYAFMASADTDITDLIGYYGRVRQLYVDDEKITLRITPSRILLSSQVVIA